MLEEIKNKIEQELIRYTRDLDRVYSLSRGSPLLSASIKDFLLRKGKHIRPALFVLGYLGFAKKPAGGLYKAALSFELLHDFLLVHDDIVDKAATRRGRPSMHRMLDNYLHRFKNIKFNGRDLAMLVGDVVFALAIDAFLSIKEEHSRKEQALSKFIRATILTGMGEFIELLSGAKDIAKITKADIYKIYDYKTAGYTFVYPLSCGAALAGARTGEIDKLEQYGIYLGRAFQIKDDTLGIFGEEKKIGKSLLTDLQEAKKTLILCSAYQRTTPKKRLIIQRVLAKDKVDKTDLLKIRRLIRESGALEYVQKEIWALLKNAQQLIKSSRMHKKYKTLLYSYTQELLTL